MQYAVKAGQASTADESFWQSSMTAAQSAFCQRHGYLSQTSLSGPRLFGIQCTGASSLDCSASQSRYFYVYRTHSLGHEEGCHSRAVARQWCKVYSIRQQRQSRRLFHLQSLLPRA